VPPPAWTAAGGQSGDLWIELASLGATLLLPASLVDFFTRFPEGRPGRRGRALANLGYWTAAVLFGLAAGTGLAESLHPGGSSAARILGGGTFEALAALFFCGAILVALWAFAASYRRAAAAHRARLTLLVWAVSLGLLPMAGLTLLKNLAPGAVLPGERW